MKSIHFESAPAVSAPGTLRSTLRSIVAAIRRASDARRRRREAHATYRALSELSGAQLRDIGLDRSQLMSVAIEIADGAGDAGRHAERSRPGRVLPPAILWHAFR